MKWYLDLRSTVVLLPEPGTAGQAPEKLNALAGLDSKNKHTVKEIPSKAAPYTLQSSNLPPLL